MAWLIKSTLDYDCPSHKEPDCKQPDCALHWAVSFKVNALVVSITYYLRKPYWLATIVSS